MAGKIKAGYTGFNVSARDVFLGFLTERLFRSANNLSSVFPFQSVLGPAAYRQVSRWLISASNCSLSSFLASSRVESIGGNFALPQRNRRFCEVDA